LHGVLCRKCKRSTGKISKLNEISQPPFQFFLNNKHFFTASPERYLKRDVYFTTNKGTAKRFSDEEDEKAKAQLHRIQKQKIL
jgi:anthranilate/para-aminobenzoate synthase component I